MPQRSQRAVTCCFSRGVAERTVKQVMNAYAKKEQKPEAVDVLGTTEELEAGGGGEWKTYLTPSVRKHRVSP